MLALLACTGLIASFHTIIFAYGRQIYSLSRAGYFPTWLSVTHGTRETPQRALLAGSALGFAVALAIHLTPQGSPVGAILLNMAVFGAVLAYILQMASFILLRVRFPRMARPYVSPVGIPGAALAAVVAARDPGGAVPQSGLQQGCDRRGHLVSAGYRLLRRLRAAPPGAGAGGEDGGRSAAGSGRAMNLRDLLAKASPARSGDELAGIAAATAEERARAQMELADVPLKAVPGRAGDPLRNATKSPA